MDCLGQNSYLKYLVLESGDYDDEWLYVCTGVELLKMESSLTDVLGSRVDQSSVGFEILNWVSGLQIFMKWLMIIRRNLFIIHIMMWLCIINIDIINADIMAY